MKKVFTEADLNNMPVDPLTNKPFVWVIDGDCLYDETVPIDLQPIFEDHDEVLDVSEEYPENNGLVVRFMKNGEELADFLCSEYLGSILLSEPQLINLFDYPYGRYVASPNAKFDGEKFIILDQDVTNLPMWVPGKEK
jgi:hypothetical protein